MESSAADQREFLLIEGLRGLAAALVLFTHYWAFTDAAPPWLRFTHTGVDLFFVLSGYVFGPYFFGKPLQPAAFWIRRFFRIYPLFLLALGVYVLLKYLQQQPLLYLWEHLSFTYLQSKAMAFYYNPPFWSLPSEVSFYLVLPGVAWLLLRITSPQGRWAVLAVLFGLMVATRATLGYHADYAAQNGAFIWLHHLPGVGIEFLLGAAVWRAVRQPGLPLAAGLGLAVLGAAGWGTLAWHFGEVGDVGINASLLRGQLGALSAVCYALLLAGLLVWLHNCPADVLQTRPVLRATLLWAGKLSYGTYLFHMASLLAIQRLGQNMGGLPTLDATWYALAVTLGSAWLAHLYCEQPLRAFGRRMAGIIELKWGATRLKGS